MATPPIGPIKTLRMIDGLATEPIVDNPKLKPMSGTLPIRRRIGGKILAMGDVAEPVAGDVLMKPVSSGGTVTQVTPRRDQEAPMAASSDAGPKSVRLRLRISHGKASVIGVHVVPGVMPAPERLDFGLAYEVMNGKRRVSVGSVPDVGMRRSYPDPKGRPGMQGHHLAELESIEVNLRLPHVEFSESALAKLHVQFFRMKGQPPATTVGAAPLAEQFSEFLRPVAELRGIDVKLLPERLQGDLAEAMFVAPRRIAAPR